MRNWRLQIFQIARGKTNKKNHTKNKNIIRPTRHLPCSLKQGMQVIPAWVAYGIHVMGLNEP